MSRISRFVVLVTALASLLGVVSSSASAVTWTNDGSTNFTATGGQGTLTSSGGTVLSCTGTDMAGDAPLTATATTYLVRATLFYTGCFAAGSPSTVECGVTLTLTAFTAPVATGVLEVTCGTYISGTKLCHTEWAAHATYTNETATLQTTTTTSVAVTGASCPYAGNGHLTALDFRVTSAVPPTITRHA